jgi:hypothetical protein
MVEVGAGVDLLQAQADRAVVVMVEPMRDQTIQEVEVEVVQDLP